MGRRDDDLEGIRIKRDVLRRVVSEKLESLLRGDFYVRNHLGEDSYDPIVTEVRNFLWSDPSSSSSGGGGGVPQSQPGQQQQQQNNPQQSQSQQQQQSPPPFSEELDKFIQIIAASIMIDASMRGENAGESDPRYIKKRKKLLAKTLKGTKFHSFCKEILRFEQRRKGEKVDDEDEVEYEEEDEEEKDPESEDEDDASRGENGKGGKHGSSDSASSDHEDSHLSDTSATSLSKSGAEDGFSTSATSSKHHKKKKEKKRRKKEKKEKRRRERRERREKRKREKEKQKKLKEESRSKKRRKHEHHDEREEQLDGSEGENELDAEMDEGYGRDEKKRAKQLEIVPSREPATKEEFEKYRDEVLSRVPKNVKKRFREGGFSKWGANMLPVLEIGPFDVEPGPVRDMWMDMYNNTRKSGREMTRLVFWYGVKFEDRGQAYSFIPSKNIISYEEGQEKGYCEMPRKLRKKVAEKKKLSKTEEQIRRGLKEITEDMQRPKSERIKWMMKFQEDWELPDVDEEEPEEEVDSPEPLPKKAKKIIADEIRAELEQPIKRKPGRPKKADKEREEKARREKIAMLEQIEREERLEKEKNDGKVEKSGKSKKKSSTAKKFTIIDEDQDSDVESIEDRDDKSYNGGESSDDNVCDAEESDASNKEEIKPEPDENPQKQLSETDGRKNKKKPKEEMTPEELEEEKNRERERQQTYRENRKKKRAAELGIEYIPGERLQKKKSKKKLLQEEQTKFTRCEDIFLPTMDGLRESKEKSDAELALKHLSIILKNVQLLTPAFVRAYSIGVLVKSVRKFFESSNSKVKEECKRATVEMKRVFSEKEAKEPEGFQPKIRDISIKSANGKDEVEGSKRESISDSDFPSRTDSPHQSKEESEFPTDPSFSNAPPKPAESTSMRTNDVTTSNQIHSSEPSTSLGKVEAPKPSRNVFSIKGMFDKPKPAPIPKPKVTPNTPSSGQVTPKPKILPSWVTGPAVKVDDFHEQHAKERNFALEFLVDATSPSSSEKFDCVSVSRAFELAIFAETKLRGRDWKTYWEKVHDIVAMLSPGRDQSNAILQGIIVGDYPDPSELVKLSRREIHSLNSRRLK